MGREWQPGDVAHIPGIGPAVRTKQGAWSSAYHANTDHYVGAEPLVVISPKDREQVERVYLDFLESLRRRGISVGLMDASYCIDSFQQTLREIADPKPPRCPAVLHIGGEQIECERDGSDHPTDHRNDSIGQGVRWSA